MAAELPRGSVALFLLLVGALLALDAFPLLSAAAAASSSGGARTLSARFTPATTRVRCRQLANFYAARESLALINGGGHCPAVTANTAKRQVRARCSAGMCDAAPANLCSAMVRRRVRRQVATLCGSPSPPAGGEPGSPSPIPSAVPTEAAQCANTQTNGSRDLGCTERDPLCRGEAGRELRPGETGDACFPCAGLPSNVDVCIAVDSSNSVDVEEYALQRQFSLGLVQAIAASSPDARFGYITWGSFFFVLSRLRNQSVTSNSIANFPRIDFGESKSELAFFGCNVVFGYQTEQRPRLIVLVTDGEPTDPEIGVRAANREKANGATVVVLGVGLEGCQCEESFLKNQIASSPSLFVKADNYSQLVSLAGAVNNLGACLG